MLRLVRAGCVMVHRSRVPSCLRGTIPEGGKSLPVVNRLNEVEIKQP